MPKDPPKMEDRFTAQAHTNRNGSAAGNFDDMTTAGSDFVDFIRPLFQRLELYDPSASPKHQPKNDSTDPARAIPQAFIDCMIIREEVYVKEQNVPLENEFDAEDERCYHWVAYASIPNNAWRDGTASPDGVISAPRRESTSSKLPIGTIRIVPPPNNIHVHLENHRTFSGELYEGPLRSAIYKDEKESFIMLGRLAVIKDFRKTGISKILIEAAIAFARDHSQVLNQPIPPREAERIFQKDPKDIADLKWKGLILVHAQTGVQKVWERHGFKTDEEFGKWDEEGIEHVAMWKRLEGFVEHTDEKKEVADRFKAAGVIFDMKMKLEKEEQAKAEKEKAERGYTGWYDQGKGAGGWYESELARLKITDPYQKAPNVNLKDMIPGYAHKFPTYNPPAPPKHNPLDESIVPFRKPTVYKSPFDKTDDDNDQKDD